MPFTGKVQALALRKNILKMGKKIKELERLYAQEIQKVADLLKENLTLESELNNLKCKCDNWKRYYEKSHRKKIPICDRNKAMVVHGELTIGEASGH